MGQLFNSRPLAIHYFKEDAFSSIRQWHLYHHIILGSFSVSKYEGIGGTSNYIHSHFYFRIWCLWNL